MEEDLSDADAILDHVLLIILYAHTAQPLLHHLQRITLERQVIRLWIDDGRAGLRGATDEVHANVALRVEQPGPVEIEGRWPLDPDEAQDMPVEPDAGLHIPAHATGMVEGPHWQWAGALTLVFHAT